MRKRREYDSNHFVDKRRPWGGKYMENNQEETKRIEIDENKIALSNHIENYKELNECKIHLNKQKLEITALFNVIHSILKPSESEEVEE